jgi:hypothetical protein
MQLDRRHPCLQRRVLQRRQTSQISDRDGLFVLPSHAGRDACAPVAFKSCYNRKRSILPFPEDYAQRRR